MGTGETVGEDDFGDTGVSSSTDFVDDVAAFHMNEPEYSDGPLPTPRPRGGRGGKRGGKRGGSNGGGVASRAVGISKALSKILRHDAVKEGLKLDGEGYARVDELLKWHRLKNLKVDLSDLREVVSDNSKQRFSLKANPDTTPPPTDKDTDPSHWLIRANQGHSIAIESASLLKPITLAANNIPEIVVHGSYFAYYPLILSSGGLKKMTRNHVHFSTGLPEDKEGVISGMRNDAELLIYVDVKKAIEDGMEWWMSDNGVVLTEGNADGVVPTKYFQKVEGRKLDVGVLWQDGEQRAELPASVRSKKAPKQAPKPKVAHVAKAVADARKEKGRSKIEQPPVVGEYEDNAQS